ncbi:perilipin-2 [Xyrichtys novacula]|uniref:Perilipin n=1 Tax=Xyrichtys novacula TaxID=13765 RepID=A0AAV1HMD5_XYRNO|nr:perilipin-2 [Xyrichtys novacula]
MHGGMEKTRAVVSGGVVTVLESRVVQLVSSGVDTALSTSESLVEQYLPLTEDELEMEAKNVSGFDNKETSYYVRLGSLSTKLRKRAYNGALTKIQDGKERSRKFISELNTTVDLIEYGRKNIGGANQMVNDKLSSLVGWKSSGSNQDNSHEAEVRGCTLKTFKFFLGKMFNIAVFFVFEKLQVRSFLFTPSTQAIESRTLALARSLTKQLQTTCQGLVSSLQGLPNNIQQEALSLSGSATHIYNSFSKAKVLGDLPDSVLTSSKVHLNQMKDSLDHVMDYLINNTPLNWLVGPFYPRMEPEPSQKPVSATCCSPTAPSGQTHSEEPMEVEMQSFQSKPH